MTTLRRCLTLISCVALVLGCACRRQPPPYPNVVLVVVDTLRADRLGAYGSTRGLTPFLDELSTRGTVFRNAYATSSWTPPSVASLLTSRYPSQHQVSTHYSRIGDAEMTLPERLQGAPYATLGFSANLRLMSGLGFGQGFDVWRVHPQGPVKPRGEELRKECLPLIDARCVRSGGTPCFVYLQYMEPHAPYEPPEPFASRFGQPVPDGVNVRAAKRMVLSPMARALTGPAVQLLASYYDGEVAAVDAELRTLFAELDGRGFLQHAIVIITADHGEEFMEHGWMSHGSALYDESVRVPLILVGPRVAAGHTIERPVSLVDVAPTVLELAGLPPEPRFEGRSLVPLLSDDGAQGPAAGAPDVVLELERSGTRIDYRRHSAGMIRATTKYLLDQVGGRAEVFDLAANPREIGPRMRMDDPRAVSVQQELEAFRAMLRARAASGERGQVDAATKEKLRALGYHF